MARRTNLAVRKTPEPQPEPVIGPMPIPYELPKPVADHGTLAGEFQALAMLRRLLEGVRVKTIGGQNYAHGKCMACNHPHPNGICRTKCPCHEVKTFLSERNIEVDV